MNDFEIQQPMQVANYIIDRAIGANSPISNLHLQKILYFLQAAFLVEYGNPLMSGNFSRWSYGPVMAEVYDVYKINGSSMIYEVAPNVFFQRGELMIDPPLAVNLNDFTDDSLSFLEHVTDVLINSNPWDLVNSTHKQKIWSKFERQIDLHIARNYTNREIECEFIDNIGDQIWR